MRKFIPVLLVASALAGCNTVRGVGADVASVANAFDPARTYAVCGSYGPIDANNDGRISQAEWNAYRAGAYRYWDVNGDGRIDATEYSNCWYGGGFYNNYNRASYTPSYSAFDLNHDGYISADEYYNAQYYASLDRNHDGFIDASEWPW